MRSFVTVLNLIVVVFFSFAFGYTFFARDHIHGLAKEFVTAKTVKYAKTLAPVVDEVLKSPLADKVLAIEQKEAIVSEIHSFNDDPHAYVSDLTEQKDLPVPKLQLNPLVNKVTSVKQKIRDYYGDTLNELILDLRIFSGSNFVAGFLGLLYVIASWYSDREVSKMLVVVSIFTFAGVVFYSYVYIDEMSFFTIITRSYFGWGYPFLLFSGISALFWDHGGRATEVIDQIGDLESTKS